MTAPRSAQAWKIQNDPLSSVPSDPVQRHRSLHLPDGRRQQRGQPSLASLCASAGPVRPNMVCQPWSRPELMRGSIARSLGNGRLPMLPMQAKS